MAITATSDNLSVVIVALSHVWIRLRLENDLSASARPMGRTARIFDSSRTLGKKIWSACCAITFLIGSSFPSRLFQKLDHRKISLSNVETIGRTWPHFSFRIPDSSATSFLFLFFYFFQLRHKDTKLIMRPLVFAKW